MKLQGYFSSIQADGTTDRDNVGDELFLVMLLDGKDKKIHIHSTFLAVREPKSVDANGLFDYFKVCAETS